MPALTQKGQAITFAVRVLPRASRTEVRGEIDGAVKIALAAPPVDGAANQELIRFLAKLLAIPIRQVSILTGHHAKNKVIEVEGIGKDDVARILAGAMPGK